MPDLTALFARQAQASAHVQFVFNLATGQVEFINDAYRLVLDGVPEQVNAELPQLLARLHPDDQPRLAEYWTQWSQGVTQDEVEFRLRHPEDQDQWFQLTPYYEQSADGTVWLVGSLRDISVNKRYQANADLFNSRKNATLEILSHDLSGAFIIVQQIAEFLREEVQAPANPQVTVMLRELEITSRDSVKMIRDFINIEFLTSANSDLKRDRVDVGAVLREPLDQLSTMSIAHHFAYTLPTAPLYANLDVNKFTQVLVNLVSNALKFTPDEGHISVVIEPGPGSVRIHVHDNGVGIPLDLQPVLFEPFTKARRPGLRSEPSTGLGLVLCKTIVEWHRGTLEMVSAEGLGTTFTIEIPQSDGVQSAIPESYIESQG